MIKPEVIRKRLQKLDEYLEILQHSQQYTFQEFIAEPERYGSAERFLQLAIELLSDMGNHVVAESGLGTVNWQSNIPELFAQNGYLTDELKDIWIRMIGFRNILVHEYLEIDRKIVFDVLQHNLDDMQALKKVFAQFL